MSCQHQSYETEIISKCYICKKFYVKSNYYQPTQNNYIPYFRCTAIKSYNVFNKYYYKINKELIDNTVKILNEKYPNTKTNHMFFYKNKVYLKNEHKVYDVSLNPYTSYEYIYIKYPTITFKYEPYTLSSGNIMHRVEQLACDSTNLIFVWNSHTYIYKLNMFGIIGFKNWDTKYKIVLIAYCLQVNHNIKKLIIDKTIFK